MEIANEYLVANKDGNKISQKDFAAQKGINLTTLRNSVRMARGRTKKERGEGDPNLPSTSSGTQRVSSQKYR
ncbi:hypothetical protein [Pasteuria penetrans]|uniref:hypothetical protein n=1 Tax=Pasteuria penetrans TaxID=86005 RepID=UPI000FBBED70|nr:hypothetical protein [Pasteuria penetrans]